MSKDLLRISRTLLLSLLLANLALAGYSSYGKDHHDREEDSTFITCC
jgi:hypothetical protein